jgi:hypothetical protein
VNRERRGNLIRSNIPHLLLSLATVYSHIGEVQRGTCPDFSLMEWPLLYG